MKRVVKLGLFVAIIFQPQSLFAMHIAEGFLPANWCVFWYIVSLPFVIWGVKIIKKRMEANSQSNLLLGVAGGFSFLLSALKLPSFTGSCSHMIGTGLGAILFGPAVMSVIGLIVLFFQALFLAHGGFSTLGANVFSMGIVGPLVSWFIYKWLISTTFKQSHIVFVAVSMGSLLTYCVTSFQLAIAFPGESGLLTSFIKFVSLFGVTQIPLSIVEGIISMLMFNFIKANNIEQLNLIQSTK
ncbi:MAG: energy-coupling factor ABC transporter permease [Paludibacter sp.]|nr:energy-coupling factor ABC transporter permease [Paludibacter sp.]